MKTLSPSAAADRSTVITADIYAGGSLVASLPLVAPSAAYVEWPAVDGIGRTFVSTERYQSSPVSTATGESTADSVTAAARGGVEAGGSACPPASINPDGGAA